MKTIYNLQICRGIAAIMVLLAHGNLIIDPKMFDSFLAIGWCGVDFFFVLSGFIIYYVNHKYIGVAAKFKQYIGKRLIRIYPIYWIYSIIVFVVFIFYYHNNYTFGYIVRTLVLYPFHTERAEYPVISPAHTLTYELIFYAIFSFGILTSKKTFIGSMLVWLALILFNMVTGIFNIGSTLINVILNPINIEFFYGCILAWLIINRTFSVNRVQARILLLSGLVLLAVSWVTQHYQYPFLLDHRYLKFGIPFTIIIYAVSLLENPGNQTRLKKLFVELGDASYSIYLVHYVGLFLINDLVFARTPYLNSFSKLMISVIALVALSYWAYKGLEQPLVKYLNKKLSRSIPVRAG